MTDRLRDKNFEHQALRLTAFQCERLRAKTSNVVVDRREGMTARAIDGTAAAKKFR